MTTGALFPKIIRFMLPLIATNLLQQLYHAADIMVVELSAEPNAVGAVGAPGSFLSLIVNLFIGFSVGANVVVARHIGAGNKEKVSRAAHTAICMGLLFGVLGAVLGILLARPVMIGMGYEGDLLRLGLRYAYIYLACMPFAALTNFLAAILQAQGNTKTSLYVLTASGVLNILLNLFFILVVGLSVEGVAIATAIANLTSATVLWLYLSKHGTDCKMQLRKLRIHREQFGEIARIGFPAGIQHALFSISNILIQSSIVEVNAMLTPAGSLYDPIIKGNTATGSLETFIFSALGATTATASAFTAQNVGAGKYDRVRRAFGGICLISVIIAIVMTTAGMLLRDPLFALYGVEKGEDILATLTYDAAWSRMLWKWPGFFIYSILNACAGTIRGLGKSTTSALITFFGTCVFRVIWIFTAFQFFKNLPSIYISYPISWLITGIFFLFVVFRLLRKRASETATA
ncbi:MAG: polysaccharide biosynthesis C-terminal domain-containing protein [Clostridia bacterium]|nr:polysaccharide biosynthesis C-terminal domain-containing protein [Clostridia bacterium]